MSGGSALLVRRAGALGILALMLLLVWAVLFRPVWNMWSGLSDQAERSAELIERLGKIAAETPALRAEASRIALTNQDRAVVFSSANPNLASAELQEEVKRIAALRGAQVQSMQQLATLPENGLNRIAVRLEFQGNTMQIAGILRDLDAHAPRIFARTISIRGNEQQLASLGQSLPLYVQLDVTAYAGRSP